MGNELSDEILQTPVRQSKRTKRKRKRNETKKNKKNKDTLNSTIDTISKELSSMKFMIGDMEISF